MGDFKKALVSSKEAIVELTPIALKGEDPAMVRVLLIAYFNCGLYDWELKNPEGSRRWFEKGKNIAKDFLPGMRSIQDVYRQIRLKLSEVTEKSLVVTSNRRVSASIKDNQTNKGVNCNSNPLGEEDLIQPFYSLRPKNPSRPKVMQAPQPTNKASSDMYYPSNDPKVSDSKIQKNNIFDKKPRPSSAYGNFNPNLGLNCQNHNNPTMLQPKDCTGSTAIASGHPAKKLGIKKRPNSAIHPALPKNSASSGQAHKIGPQTNYLDSIYAADSGVGRSLKDKDFSMNAFTINKRPQSGKLGHVEKTAAEVTPNPRPEKIFFCNPSENKSRSPNRVLEDKDVFPKGRYSNLSWEDFRKKPLYLADEYSGAREMNDRGTLIVPNSHAPHFLRDKNGKYSPYLQEIREIERHERSSSAKRNTPNPKITHKPKGTPIRKYDFCVPSDYHSENSNPPINFQTQNFPSWPSKRPQPNFFGQTPETQNFMTTYNNNYNYFLKERSEHYERLSSHLPRSTHAKSNLGEKNTTAQEIHHYYKNFSNKEGGKNRSLNLLEDDLLSWDEDAGLAANKKIGETDMLRNRDKFLLHLQELNQKLESVNHARMAQRLEFAREEDKLQSKKQKYTFNPNRYKTKRHDSMDFGDKPKLIPLIDPNDTPVASMKPRSSKRVEFKRKSPTPDAMQVIGHLEVVPEKPKAHRKVSKSKSRDKKQMSNSRDKIPKPTVAVVSPKKARLAEEPKPTIEDQFIIKPALKSKKVTRENPNKKPSKVSLGPKELIRVNLIEVNGAIKTIQRNFRRYQKSDSYFVSKFQKSRATVDGHHKLFIKLYSEQTTLDEPYKVFVFEHPRPNPHFTVIAKHIKTTKRNFELKFSPTENDTVKSILSDQNSTPTQKSLPPFKPLSIDPWTLKKIFSKVYTDLSGHPHILPPPQKKFAHLRLRLPPPRRPIPLHFPPRIFIIPITPINPRPPRP